MSTILSIDWKKFLAEQVNAQQKEFIIAAIRRFFAAVEILAYGSRIKGTAQQYSDLDLALKGASPLELSKLGELKDTFANSDIPFKIEPLDFHRVSPDFQKIIEKTCVRWG